MCSSCKSRRVNRRARASILAPFALSPLVLTAQAILPTASGMTLPGQDVTAIHWLTGPALLAQAAAPAKKEGKTKWTCPMHPHYIADHFGPCPICGMDLVKLDTGGSELGAAEAESRTVITVAPEVIQNIGVRLGKAEMSRFGRAIRSYGIVHANERLTSEFTARVEGWVQDLKIRAVGDEVKKGGPLFRLYSPRLLVSQGDFFSSRGSRGSRIRGASQLRAFGVQEKTLAEIKANRRPLELVPFYAERTGTVTHLTLKEGTYVKRGMLLARIQDYSSVWLLVSVAEKDLSFISKGATAAVTFRTSPGSQ